MTTWSSAELDSLGGADELRITTRRADGSARRPVPIWVVRMGADVFVRSFRGPDGAWYRSAAHDRQGAISVPGLSSEVAFEPAADDTASQIDQAYRDKYARYGPTYLNPMLEPTARAAPLRVMPQATPQARTPQR